MSGASGVPQLLSQERAQHPTLAPLAPIPLLATPSNCHLSFGSLGLAECSCTEQVAGVTASQCVLTFLVSSPANHQNPMQCGLLFSEQISIDRCAKFLDAYPLSSVPLPPACGLGWGKTLGPAGWWLCHFTLFCVVFVTRCRWWSVLQSSGLFHS